LIDILPKKMVPQREMDREIQKKLEKVHNMGETVAIQPGEKDSRENPLREKTDLIDKTSQEKKMPRPAFRFHGVFTTRRLVFAKRESRKEFSGFLTGGYLGY